MNNLVAIVGRPNVGKSSLFNKLIGSRKAIVHDQPGVTRDRLYQKANWLGKTFKVIDTGGIEIKDKPFQEQIKIQAQIAIEEANVILFVVDGREGITLDEEFIIKLLRKTNKQIILVANKLEGNKDMEPSIWTLGLKEVFNISAIHGEGVGDLLDCVISKMKFLNNENEDLTKISIIGRPNAGKSSLLNSLLNEERSIVSEISGTTRDSVDAIININNKKYTIIDTAGINKKSKLIESVNHYALSRARNSIIESDIVLLVIDYERDIAHFDAVVGGYAFEENKPIIMVVNKWDLAQKETMTMKNKEKELRKNFKYLSWAPIIFISAKTKLKIKNLKSKINELQLNMQKIIKTSTLNEVMNDIQIVQPAQSVNGGRLSIKFVRQVEAKIPTFIFWINRKKYLHFTYQRFLENQLREYFGFEGTPLKFIFRESKGKDYEK